MSSQFQPRVAWWPARPAAVAAAGWIAASLVSVLSVAGYLPARLAPAVAGLPAMSEDVAHRAAQAEATVRRWQDLLRQAKMDAGIPAGGDSGFDVSGLLGEELTPLVTTLGSLEAKRLSTNPAWARVLTGQLARAGIGRGDLVAASFSGSFPALNLALVAACDALGARLVAVSSVTASTWGANQPGFTWPEMEAMLVEAGQMRRVSAAVTAGGEADLASDLEADGRAVVERILRTSAERLGVPALRPRDFEDAVERRLRVYEAVAAGAPTALYVNVGGAQASMGRTPAILKLRSGFVQGVPFDRSADRGVTARFAERRVKILMLLNVRELAMKWGLPLTGR